MSEEQFYDAVLAMASPEKRLKGLPAEERLKGLPAEERLKGLPAEDLIRALRATLSEAEWRRLLEPVSPTSKDS